MSSRALVSPNAPRRSRAWSHRPCREHCIWDLWPRAPKDVWRFRCQSAPRDGRRSSPAHEYIRRLESNLPGRDDQGMKRRILAMFLWFMTFWYAGALIADVFHLNPILGSDARSRRRPAVRWRPAARHLEAGAQVPRVGSPRYGLIPWAGAPECLRRTDRSAPRRTPTSGSGRRLKTARHHR